MTDKKLTYKEIIKALECCFMEQQCNNCPLYKEHSVDCLDKEHSVDCLDTVLENAHTLITRQQAENENLKVENQSLRSAANSLKIHYEEAQAKIEEFMKETAVTTLIDDAVVYTPTLEDYNKFKKKFKFEATKEFAERVKDTFEHAYQFEYGYLISKDAINAKIDNLVKEMVGENND